MDKEELNGIFTTAKDGNHLVPDKIRCRRRRKVSKSKKKSLMKMNWTL